MENRKSTIVLTILSILAACIVILYFIGKNMMGLAPNDGIPLESLLSTVYPSQSECEEKTGKTCTFRMCDFVPQGKTSEEVCGKDFKKGWVSAVSFE